MDPYGNYIEDYKIFSMKEDLTLQFQAESRGYPGIQRAVELRGPTKFTMTRKTFLRHLSRNNHYNTVEEYLEVLNNPTIILLDGSTTYGHKVRIFAKTRSTKVSFVVVFTDSLKNTHAIASGYDITEQMFETYKKKLETIWTEDL